MKEQNNSGDVIETVDVNIISSSEDRINHLKNNNIEHEYLSRLLLEHKKGKSIDADHPITPKLAECITVAIEKIAGLPNWRNYTEDWKEDFKATALLHCLRYCHNYSSKKAQAGKNDAFNYLAMIITRAFLQAKVKCEKRSAHHVPINHDVFYEEGALDKFVNEYRDKEAEKREEEYNKQLKELGKLIHEYELKVSKHSSEINSIKEKIDNTSAKSTLKQLERSLKSNMEKLEADNVLLKEYNEKLENLDYYEVLESDKSDKDKDKSEKDKSKK